MKFTIKELEDMIIHGQGKKFTLKELSEMKIHEIREHYINWPGKSEEVLEKLLREVCEEEREKTIRECAEIAGRLPGKLKAKNWKEEILDLLKKDKE